MGKNVFVEKQVSKADPADRQYKVLYNIKVLKTTLW